MIPATMIPAALGKRSDVQVLLVRWCWPNRDLGIFAPAGDRGGLWGIKLAHRLGGRCREIIDTRFDRRWVAVGGASTDNAKQALVLTP